MTAALADADWAARAACRGHDQPDWWFSLPDTTEYRLAKRICINECPVRTECLTYARNTGQDHGVWGALDPAERRGGRPARKTIDPSVLRELAARGLSDHDISDETDIPAGTVTMLRHRHRIPSGLQVRQALAEDPDSTVLSGLVALLRSGTPRARIAQQLGVSRATIDRWCSRYRLWRLEAAGGRR